MATLTTAVLAFLAGTITGIVGMFCADSKYIKTMQNSHKNILKIMASIYKEREETRNKETKRLYEALAKYQIKEAKARK